MAEDHTVEIVSETRRLAVCPECLRPPGEPFYQCGVIVYFVPVNNAEPNESVFLCPSHGLVKSFFIDDEPVIFPNPYPGN